MLFVPCYLLEQTLKELTPIQKKGKNENGRIAPPESISIYAYIIMQLDADFKNVLSRAT